MDDEDRKKQAAVLAQIAELPEGTTIEEYNRLRVMAHIILPDKSTLH